VTTAGRHEPSAAISLRRAGSEDVDLILRDVQAGFESYVDFASPGWQPPHTFSERPRTAELLADPHTWALIASIGDAPAGHVAFFAASRHGRHSSSEPGLAHLWQLFVLPEWWGRGVGPCLHERAIAEMQARGFTRARLFTPSEHRRARRFYERRGWRAVSEAWNDNLALMLAEYRHPLDG
jgi:GNAT superfamily N-acetyltransferase